MEPECGGKGSEVSSYCLTHGVIHLKAACSTVLYIVVRIINDHAYYQLILNR